MLVWMPNSKLSLLVVKFLQEHVSKPQNLVDYSREIGMIYITIKA